MNFFYKNKIFVKGVLFLFFWGKYFIYFMIREIYFFDAFFVFYLSFSMRFLHKVSRWVILFFDFFGYIFYIFIMRGIYVRGQKF